MPTMEKTHWLRILTAFKACSSNGAKQFNTHIADVLSPLFQGRDVNSCVVEKCTQKLKYAVKDGFDRILERFKNVPPLLAAAPSKKGQEQGCYFFVPYAEPPSRPDETLILWALHSSPSHQRLCLPVRYHHASSMDDTVFKLLGLVRDCPVLLFDPMTVAFGQSDGYYYAGEHGIDTSVTRRVGMQSEESFFTSQRPEHTLIAFCDNWGKLPLDPRFAKSMLIEP